MKRFQVQAHTRAYGSCQIFSEIIEVHNEMEARRFFQDRHFHSWIDFVKEVIK